MSKSHVPAPTVPPAPDRSDESGCNVTVHCCAPTPAPEPEPEPEPCACTPRPCVWEIRLQRWKFETEADEGLFADNLVEFRFVFHLNGNALVYPGAGTYISVNEDRATLWHGANVRLGTILVEADDALEATLMVEALEVGRDTASGSSGEGRSAYGCSSVSELTLGCGKGRTSVDGAHNLTVSARRNANSNNERYDFTFDFRATRVA